MKRRRVPRIRSSALVFLFGLFALSGAAQAQVPAHLDIQSSTIREIPPIDPENVPGRGVALTLTLGAAPACNATTGFLAYGFLIDADSDSATGLPGPAFDDLGVDARVTAVCDPASGLFVSPIGTVTVVAGPGAATLEIRTTVERLPSLAFLWIAFGQEGPLFSRLPAAPEHMFFTTHEKGVF